MTMGRNHKNLQKLEGIEVNSRYTLIDNDLLQLGNGKDQ